MGRQGCGLGSPVLLCLVPKANNRKNQLQRRRMDMELHGSSSSSSIGYSGTENQSQQTKDKHVHAPAYRRNFTLFGNLSGVAQTYSSSPRLRAYLSAGHKELLGYAA